MEIERRVHWWTEDKEEIRTSLSATWRGQAVIIEIDSDRYRTSDGELTEWRHVVSAAWAGDLNEKWSAPSLTDTAKSRLRTEAVQLASSWIGSLDYIVSWQDAIVSALGAEIANLRSEHSCDRMERKVNANVADPARAAALVDAIHAYQNFVAMVEAAKRV